MLLWWHRWVWESDSLAAYWALILEYWIITLTQEGGEVSMHSSTNFFGNSKSWEDNFDLKITEMWHRAYSGRWSLIRISYRVKNLEAVTAEIQHVTFSMLEEAQGRYRPLPSNRILSIISQCWVPKTWQLYPLDKGAHNSSVKILDFWSQDCYRGMLSLCFGLYGTILFRWVFDQFYPDSNNFCRFVGKTTQSDFPYYMLLGMAVLSSHRLPVTL